MAVVHAHCRKVIPRDARNAATMGSPQGDSTSWKWYCRASPSRLSSRRWHRGNLEGKLDSGDDAAAGIRANRQSTCFAVERCEPGANIGQADAGAETFRKTDPIVADNYTKPTGNPFSADGDRPTLRQGSKTVLDGVFRQRQQHHGGQSGVLADREQRRSQS